MMLLPALLLGLVATASPLTARGGDVVEIELTISAQRLSPAGRVVEALTVDGGIPGPTLTFTEGDVARITVRSALEGEEASVHWHGLLLPNAMDGVPYLTTPPIPPGGAQVYEFPLRQSGTYWYHSHTGLQEQRGVYGAIVVRPREPDDLAIDREHVVVLSDWTDESPREVMRTLMRGSEWFSQRKGTVQTLVGAWRRGRLGEYFQRERVRMPPMDVSDVAYDAFLAGGERVHHLPAQPGERVLLRLIDAGASTYFHVTSAAGPLEIVAADGPRVKPVRVARLLMGMAETYDVVVTMPADGHAVEVRATAQDGSGHASIVLGDGPLLEADDPPKPDLYTMTEAVRAGIESVNPERGAEAATADRPFAPYALLESLRPTTLARTPDDEARVRTLTLRLTGDMRRYLWGFDGKTLSEDAVVPVAAGEILRIELVNDTMMHHPLHLHGHFFRVLNGKGDHAPLKHTVDVPPMGRRVIEWVADEEPGDWFFHCHMLYHMDAGMARVFSYREQGAEHRPTLDPKMLDPTYFLVDGTLSTSMTMGRAVAMRGRDDLLLRWDAGLDLSDHDDHADAEVDLAWSRYLDPNLATIVGYRFTDMEGARDRAFAGLRHRLPYSVLAELTFDSEADARVALEKEYWITQMLELRLGGHYDTGTYAEWEAALGWTLSKAFGVVAGYHSDHGLGVGLAFHL